MHPRYAGIVGDFAAFEVLARYRDGNGGYCTVSAKVMLCVTPPEAAETTTFETPAGVPCVDVGDEYPPPHAAIEHPITRTAAGKSKRIPRRSSKASKENAANKSNEPAHQKKILLMFAGGVCIGRSHDRAVVVIVTVNEAADVPLRLGVDGEIVQVAAVGTPVQVRDTLPVKPPGASWRL